MKSNYFQVLSLTLLLFLSLPFIKSYLFILSIIILQIKRKQKKQQMKSNKTTQIYMRIICSHLFQSIQFYQSEYQEYLELKKAYEEKHQDEIKFEQKFQQQKINKVKEVQEQLQKSYEQIVSSNKEDKIKEISGKYQKVLWGREFPFYHNWLQQVEDFTQNSNGVLLNSWLENLFYKLGIEVQKESQVDFKTQLLYPGYITYEITLPELQKYLQQKYLFYIGVQPK